MKQLFADTLNRAARFIHHRTPDAWWDAERPNVIIRFCCWLEDWADVFDLRFHNALLESLKDTNWREL